MAIEFKQADKPKTSIAARKAPRQEDRKGILAIDSFEDQEKKEPARPDSSKAKFNKSTYQTRYMRWKRAADKLGITVPEYRKLMEKEE